MLPNHQPSQKSHMKSLYRLVVLMVALTSVGAFGADSTGNYMVGGGAGGVRCPEFVATMERARTHKIGSLRYVQETQGFTMYLLGFQTGYNVSTPDTYDIFPGSEGDYPLLSWIENYCRLNPTSRFGDGVVALAQDRHAKRQRSAQSK